MASAQERNQRGTRQAMQKASALQRRGTRASHSPSGRPSKRAIRNREWDQNADRQRAEFKEKGYGGMGYGPTAPDSAMKKANARANPNQMVRDVIGKMTEPTVVRAEGSIWDDPKYAGLANEHGGEYAMKARNLDRQLNMARQTAAIRGEAQQDQLAMDEGKLIDKQIQHEASQYGPGPQSTGVDPRTGLAVDQSGAFTGEGKQAQMTGPGPSVQPAEEAMRPQDQAKMLESYSKILTDIETPQEVKDFVVQQMRQMAGGGQQTGGPRSAQEVRQKILDANPGADPNSEEFQSLYKNALQRFGLSE